MEAQERAGMMGVLAVFGRPFRRKATAPAPSPATAPKRLSYLDIPDVPHHSYEPFRDYRPGRAGDPCQIWG